MQSSYDRAIQIVEGVFEAASDARRVIAGLPNAPERYWQGLGAENPLALAWYRADRAMDELKQAKEALDTAEGLYLRSLKARS